MIDTSAPSLQPPYLTPTTPAPPGVQHSFNLPCVCVCGHRWPWQLQCHWHQHCSFWKTPLIRPGCPVITCCCYPPSSWLTHTHRHTQVLPPTQVSRDKYHSNLLNEAKHKTTNVATMLFNHMRSSSRWDLKVCGKNKESVLCLYVYKWGWNAHERKESMVYYTISLWLKGRY